MVVLTLLYSSVMACSSPFLAFWISSFSVWCFILYPYVMNPVVLVYSSSVFSDLMISCRVGILLGYLSEWHSRHCV